MLSRRQAGDCLCAKLMEQISEVARLNEVIARKDRRIAALERQLGKVTRTALEQPFGRSTPTRRTRGPTCSRRSSEGSTSRFQRSGVGSFGNCRTPSRGVRRRG